MQQPYGYAEQPYQYQINNMNIDRRPVDNLLNMYLKQEGIDKRYSQLILKELYDATDMTNDQLNTAANELIVKTPTEQSNKNAKFNPKPNV